MFVGGVLSNRVSTAQHCRLCWSDVQCETDPGMYPYLTVFNRWSINCPYFCFQFRLYVFVSKLL